MGGVHKAHYSSILSIYRYIYARSSPSLPTFRNQIETPKVFDVDVDFGNEFRHAVVKRLQTNGLFTSAHETTKKERRKKQNNPNYIIHIYIRSEGRKKRKIAGPISKYMIEYIRLSKQFGKLNLDNNNRIEEKCKSHINVYMFYGYRDMYYVCVCVCVNWISSFILYIYILYITFYETFRLILLLSFHPDLIFFQIFFLEVEGGMSFFWFLVFGEGFFVEAK